MINKFEKIISVGKFRNHTASGQVNFHKLTTIFGDNGGGKTTLTAIIRSLNTNNPSIVHSRISTNHVSPQAIQITTNNGATNDFHTFGSSGWTAHYDDIEIFDVHFVNENVYSGFEFTENHKKGLHKFVIGAQGVIVQQQIEQNKTDKAAIRASIESIGQQIISQTGNNLSSVLLNPFVSLRPTAGKDIDDKIVAAKLAVSSANSNSLLRTLPKLNSLEKILDGTSFDDAITDVGTDIEIIQDNSLNNLYDAHCKHLEENKIENAEAWLKIGFDSLNQKEGEVSECPFCKQELNEGIDIIKSYANIFNATFNDLTTKLNGHEKYFNEKNVESLATGITTKCDGNDTTALSWSAYLPASIVAPVNDILPLESGLKDSYEACLSIIQSKNKNPTQTFQTVAISSFKKLIEEINERIEKYNAKVTTYNTGIDTFLTTIQSVESAQLELDKLNRIKKRFDTAIDNLCVKYTNEKRALSALEVSYAILAKQQAADVSIFFGQYKDKVNHYLKDVFRTHFQVDAVVHVPPQGQATSGKMNYKLVIDGKDVSFAPGQPLSVKECLSEGDKTTIAFAFFMAKLDIDPNKANKILVFDDPLSSLDTNRRLQTTRIIRRLVNSIKQVIVLSHNEHFLYEICDQFPAASKKNLRITENFAAKASKIEECDLDELVKSDYFKQLDALEAFRSNPDHAIIDTVLGWLRNVLEGHIKFKFYKTISAMAGQKTFGNLIRHLRDNNIPFRDNTDRVNIIERLNMINSISWKPHHGDPMPDYSALGMNPNSITASELDGLIQDTLELVDNKL